MKEKLQSFFFRFREDWHRLAPKKRSAGARWALTLTLLLLAVVGLLFLCLLIGTQNFSFQRLGAYFEAPLILIMNLLPMVLVLALMYALFNRAWAAWLATALFFFLFFFINYFKVALRGEPLVADDLFIAGEGAGILEEYTLDIPPLFYLSLLLIGLVAALLARYARGSVDKKRWWVRILTVALCAVVGTYSWSAWYTDYILYTNTRLSIQRTFSNWRDEEVTAGGGLVWSFLRSVDEAFPEAPEGYSQEQMNTLLADYPDVPIPEDKRVNVVVTMLESYSDLSLFESVEFTSDPYEAFHALQTESYHGTLIADSIGGGTVNAERSFLTGFAYRHPGYRRNTMSFVRYFSDNGYTTTGAHPGVGWFYSRESINRWLGFDSYLFHDGYYETMVTEENRYANYVDDSTFFTERREAYEQRDPSQPYFSFSVTYQGHSPYDDTALTGKEYVSREGLSNEAYYAVNNYLSSIAETGEAVRSYVDSFRKDTEPVVLVFFGDHKPTLGENNIYYRELGITGNLNGSGERFSLYSTPYLIWANDAAKEALGMDFSGVGDTISPCYLMSVVFDCCGWEGSTWLRYQRTLRESLPVLHMRNYALIGGSLTLTYTDKARDAHEKFDLAEYYIREQVPQ